MPLYNVAQAVTALIEAETEEAAQHQLDARLDAAGFSTYPRPFTGPVTLGAFLSEDQPPEPEHHWTSRSFVQALADGGYPFADDD